MVLAEKETDSTFEQSQGYAWGLYWRAYVLGGLAHFWGGTYDSEYEGAYSDAITFLETRGSSIQKKLLPAVYWRYALYLMLVEDDATTASKQLQKLMTSPSGLSGFKVALKQMRELPSTAIGRQQLNITTSASTEFKNFVDSIQ